MTSNISRRKYHNSPLVEAIFEIQFDKSETGDDFLEEIYEPLKYLYPFKSEGERITFEQIKEKEATKNQIVKSKALRLTSDNGLQAVFLTSNFFAFSTLNKDYEKFESFSSRIADALGVYQTSIHPGYMNQFRLRYLSEIKIQSNNSEIDLSEYFNYYPEIKGHDFFHFVLEFEVGSHYRDHETFVSMKSFEQDKPGFFLFSVEIYSIYKHHSEFQIDFLQKKISESHENIGRVFEAFITDKTRILLKEDKNEQCSW